MLFDIIVDFMFTPLDEFAHCQTYFHNIVGLILRRQSRIQDVESRILDPGLMQDPGSWARILIQDLGSMNPGIQGPRPWVLDSRILDPAS